MASFNIIFLVFGLVLALAKAQSGVENTYANCVTTTKGPTKCPSEHYCERTTSGCFRSFDGTCNNKKRTNLGAINTSLRRLIPAQYADGVDTPRGHHRDPNYKHYPTPHQVSKAAFRSTAKVVDNTKKLSTLFMTFGQFLDHDLSVAPHEECNVTDCSKEMTRKYPCFPLKFDHHSDECTGLGRAKPACKDDPHKPRDQINELTSFVDLSQVYGTTEKIAKKLRKNDGSGQLKVTKRNLLPVDFEKTAKPKCKNPAKCHLVGDDRGEENIALFAMHILWVREHNRVAKELKWINPHWTGEQIFQTARKICGATFQNIVYKEYLPKIIYPFDRKESATTKYDPHADPSIINAFSAAAFRYGHSLIPNSFSQMDGSFNKAHDDVRLQHAFENSTQIDKFGIGTTMMGLCGNMSDTVDNVFAHDILNKLFVFPGSKLHNDLTALNIQRARDHGIPTYGKWREFCGHPPARDFYDLLYTPKEIRKAFSNIYRNVNDIDLFAAGITERHVGSKIVGPTFHCIIQQQFKALRDGDRFFYTHNGVFKPGQLETLKKTSLSKVMCNNLKDDGMVSLQRDAFKVFNPKNDRRVTCESIEDIDLTQWRDRRARHRPVSHGYQPASRGYQPPVRRPYRPYRPYIRRPHVNPYQRRYPPAQYVPRRNVWDK